MSSPSSHKFDRSGSWSNLGSLSNDLRRARRLADTADRILKHNNEPLPAMRTAPAPKQLQHSTHEQASARRMQTAPVAKQRAVRHDESAPAKRRTSRREALKKGIGHLMSILLGLGTMVGALAISAGIIMGKCDVHFAIILGVGMCAMTGMILSLSQKNQELEYENDILFDQLHDMHDDRHDEHEHDDDGIDLE